MAQQTVLYLDIDDTLLHYRNGRPQAAPGAREFLLWALDALHVRWLTRWCPGGRLTARLASDLAHMLGVEPERVRRIRGLDWGSGASKLDGIAWLEHVVLGRPFLWIEDDFGVAAPELEFLRLHGFTGSYICCNVTSDLRALTQVHGRLVREFGGMPGRRA